jgi:hypothetical protein
MNILNLAYEAANIFATCVAVVAIFTICLAMGG